MPIFGTLCASCKTTLKKLTNVCDCRRSKPWKDDLYSKVKPEEVPKYKSPINIPLKSVVQVRIPKLILSPEHWSCNVSFELQNTGYYADYRFDGKKSLNLSGGPVNGIFKMFGFHFHWADTDNNGAEHALDFKKYAGEIHVVYYNGKYANFQEALRSPNGVVVLGFFLKAVKDRRNDAFYNLTRDVKNVLNEGSKFTVQNVCMELFKPVVDSGSYYHYLGSLTKLKGDPALWIVYKRPISILNQQLDVFRTMKTKGDRPLSNIYPLQPLNGRTVYEAI